VSFGIPKRPFYSGYRRVLRSFKLFNKIISQNYSIKHGVIGRGKEGGNLPAVPPIQTKELNPLIGLQQSKIDFYQLGDVVREKVEEGLLPNDITNYINDNYFPDVDQKISDKSVRRWIKKNIDPEDNDYDINLYNKCKEDIQSCEDTLEIIDIYCNEIRRSIRKREEINSKELKDYLFIKEKFLGRKQSQQNDLFKMQKEIRSWMMYIDMMNSVFGDLKDKYPEAYSDCLALIKSNQEWMEAMKKIEPNK
jgi:hypothetical protein